MAQLPLAQWPTMQRVDLSPINDALDAVAAKQKQNVLKDAGGRLAAGDSAGAANALFDAGMLDQGVNIQNTAAAQKRTAMQDQALIVNRAGGLAQIGMQTTDPNRKAAILNRITALDPKMKDGIASSGIDISNPDEVFKYVANEAQGYQGYKDPTSQEAERLGNEKTRAEINALNTKDASAEADAQFMKSLFGNGGNAAAQPSQPPSPTTPQPQSFTPSQGPGQPSIQPVSNVVSGDTQPTRTLSPPPPPAQTRQQATPASPQPALRPGVVLTGNEAPNDGTSVDQPIAPQADPGQAAQPPGPNPSDVYNLPGTDVINTPMGPMTRDQARKVGAWAAYRGKGDFGKMMIDASSGGGDKIGQTGRNQIDKDEIGSTNQLATLNNIQKAYDARWLNIPTRFQQSWNSLVGQFGTLDAQSQKDLTAYSQFKQAAWHNLNRVLKDLSGTAVTGNELERQLNDLPNPGTNPWNGDDPVSFKAKLDGAVAYTKSAIARSRFLRNQGFQGKPWEAGLAVEDMPAIINQRGAQIQQQLQQKDPHISPMDLQQGVKTRLQQEFGI